MIEALKRPPDVQLQDIWIQPARLQILAGDLRQEVMGGCASPSLYDLGADLSGGLGCEGRRFRE